MGKRKPRIPNKVRREFVAIFFLDVPHAIRLPYVKDVDEQLEWVPDHVRACMRELLLYAPVDTCVPYIQVLPLPEGYRSGDALRVVE